MSTIFLAGGCFWGTEKFFEQFDGVTGTAVGYANGPEVGCGGPGNGPSDESARNSGGGPSYEDVCNNSGHAETVKIEFDESRISLRKLLEYYFMVIDPLSVNKQGHDRGIQYRTGIYYTDPVMLDDIRAVYDEVQSKVGSPLAVELEPLRNFYYAEDYHQKYLDKNPGGYCHIPAAMLNLTQK